MPHMRSRAMVAGFGCLVLGGLLAPVAQGSPTPVSATIPLVEDRNYLLAPPQFADPGQSITNAAALEAEMKAQIHPNLELQIARWIPNGPATQVYECYPAGSTIFPTAFCPACVCQSTTDLLTWCPREGIHIRFDITPGGGSAGGSFTWLGVEDPPAVYQLFDDRTLVAVPYPPAPRPTTARELFVELSASHTVQSILRLDPVTENFEFYAFGGGTMPPNGWTIAPGEGYLVQAFGEPSGACTPPADARPPICSGDPTRLPSPAVNGTASDNQTDDTGIVRVELAAGSSNLALSVPGASGGGGVFTFGTPQSSITFAAVQTNAALPAQGSILIRDDADNTCGLPVQFVILPPGPLSNATLCSGAGITLQVTNESPTLPGGTAVCSADLPSAATPPLPDGYEFSPADDPFACRALAVDSPVSGQTLLGYEKQGAFDSRLRLLFSKFDGVSFPPFTDITQEVEAGSTKLSGRATMSEIKTACATLTSPATIPMADPLHLAAFCALLALWGGWLLRRSHSG